MDNQLNDLKTRASKINNDEILEIQAIVQNKYNEIRKLLLDKNKIDDIIAKGLLDKSKSIAICKTKAHISTKKRIFERVNELIELPQYGYDKSLLDELHNMYPANFKFYGKTCTDDWQKAHGTYYYTEYYVVKLKIKDDTASNTKNKQKCNIL